MYSVVLMMALSGGAQTPEFGCGGCYGCGWYGCGGCYGGRVVGYGCGGCYGGVRVVGGYGCCGGVRYGCCGGGPRVAPPPDLPPGGPPPGGPPQKTPPPPPPKKGVSLDNTVRARIQVTLPENAKLSFDGHETVQTTPERVFHTPVLPAGREFHYTLRAEAMIDGQSVVKTERIAVRAGETTRVNFEFANSGVATR